MQDLDPVSNIIDWRPQGVPEDECVEWGYYFPVWPRCESGPLRGLIVIDITTISLAKMPQPGGNLCIVCYKAKRREFRSWTSDKLRTHLALTGPDPTRNPGAADRDKTFKQNFQRYVDQVIDDLLEARRFDQIKVGRRQIEQKIEATEGVYFDLEQKGCFMEIQKWRDSATVKARCAKEGWAKAEPKKFGLTQHVQKDE